MAKKLLHTLGCDEEGRITHVNDTEKGGIYTCPLCADRIIARNNGTVQRPHFAHFKKSEQCNGESVLHHYLYEQTVRLIQHHLETNKPFLIEWHCPYCNRKYSKNLLLQAASVTTKFSMDERHPDIILLNEKEEPIFALKLLIRKKITKRALHYYEEKGIILIQYQLDETDWSKIEDKLHHPSSVTFCDNKECYNFQFFQNSIRREYYSQKFKCKKCGKVVDGYMVRNTSALGVIGLDHLRDDEKQEIVNKFFRGKRATVADILVYGKCHCVPHSKGLICLNKSDDFKEARQGKITKRR